ncbi:MAG: hypothetical protein H0V92_07455 [Pseudonocardiales bacterium]|nr:hypothetical protein [Pseudonocardiales bacterium]
MPANARHAELGRSAGGNSRHVGPAQVGCSAAGNSRLAGSRLAGSESEGSSAFRSPRLRCTQLSSPLATGHRRGRLVGLTVELLGERSTEDRQRSQLANNFYVCVDQRRTSVDVMDTTEWN